MWVHRLDLLRSSCPVTHSFLVAGDGTVPRAACVGGDTPIEMPELLFQAVFRLWQSSVQRLHSSHSSRLLLTTTRARSLLFVFGFFWFLKGSCVSDIFTGLQEICL